MVIISRQKFFHLTYQVFYSNHNLAKCNNFWYVLTDQNQLIYLAKNLIVPLCPVRPTEFPVTLCSVIQNSLTVRDSNSYGSS